MSNFPFDTFPLTKRVGIVNPVGNVDARYGPWLSLNDALTAFSTALRHVGLTVAVSANNTVTEYWYKDGIADNNLVLKANSGPQGATGASGVQGSIGATGASGLRGTTGPIGATGASGVQGNIGATGASGVQGNIGATGASGLQGNIGATGASGVQGNIGATGASGLQGNTGPIGATGASGVQGNIGATGASGLRGTTGPIGATGASGIQGNIGATGSTADVLPIVTNYLSSNNVLISSLNVFDRFVVDGQLYYSTDNLTSQLNALSGNYDEGQFLGKVKLSQNNTRLVNVGENWTPKDSSREWRGIAMSSDGKYQSAVVANGQIYISNDYGNNWTPKDSNRIWQSIAMSSDGKYQSAVVSGGQIYISNDYGNTWAAKESNRSWQSIAMSSDGKYQSAVVTFGQIYVSSDYGNNWTPKDSNRIWRDIAMSSDGKYQSAVVSGGQIYVSSDYGNNWTPKDSNRSWYDIAMSSDGKYQSAVVGAVVFGGQIYTSVADELIDGSLTVTNISATGTLFGRAQDSQLSLTSSNTVQNSAVTSRLNTLEQTLSSLADPPNYIQPAATLEAFNNYEVGQNFTQILDVGWNQGSAGSLVGGTVTRNDIVVLTYNSLPTTYTVTETASAINVSFKNNVSYNQGPVLNNSLGYPSPVGQIPAGSKTVERILRGQYRVFFGSYATLPSSPTAVRLLTGNKFDTGISPSEFGTIWFNNIVFFLPGSKVLTSVITTNNEQIKDNFTVSPTSIPLPNGVLAPYNYCRLTTVVPLGIPLLTITYG